MKVELDEENHIYHVDGKIVPGVTEIITPPGRKFYLAGSAERGHRVHAATVMYDNGLLTVDDCPEYLRGWLKAWADFRKDTGFEPTIIEGSGCSADGRYAGTIDRIGTIPWKSGVRLMTIDIKSGGKEKKHILQLAGYYGIADQGGVDGSMWNGANDLGIVYIKPTGDYSFDRIMDSYRMNAMIEFQALLKLNQSYREAV
jgi:hypothetical protein